jgi:hypothetical protein
MLDIHHIVRPALEYQSYIRPAVWVEHAQLHIAIDRFHDVLARQIPTLGQAKDLRVQNEYVSRKPQGMPAYAVCLYACEM